MLKALFRTPTPSSSATGEPVVSTFLGSNGIPISLPSTVTTSR